MSELNEEKKKETNVKGNVAGTPVEIHGHDDGLTAEGGNVEKRKADTELKKVHESFSAIFEGVELPEDFAVKAEAIMEAAINERVSQVKAELTEQHDARLTAVVEEVEQSFVNTADRYMEFVAERWLNENRIAVVAEARVAKANSLVESLRSLLAEHSIELTEAEAKEIDTLKAQLKEANERYNSLAEELMEANKTNSELGAQLALKEIQEGMVMTDAERLASLVEGFDTSDLDRYKTKVLAVKEANFTESAKVEKPADALNEAFEGTPEVKAPVNDPMAQLAESLKRHM